MAVRPQDLPLEGGGPLAKGLHVAAGGGEDAEGLVDGVAEVLGRRLPDEGHDAGGHFGVELVVGGEGGHLAFGELAAELVVGRSGLDSQPLGLVAAGHDASVVVGKYNDGLSLEVGAEDALAGDVAVVAVDDGVVVHRLHRLMVQTTTPHTWNWSLACTVMGW